MRALLRGLVWTVASSVLLLAAFGGLVLGLVYLGQVTGSINSDAHLTTRVLTATYFRVVFFKGLLPQLLLALLLWGLLGRWLAGRAPSTRRELLGLTAVAALAYAVVAPLLLTTSQPEWPALQMRSFGQHLSTLLLCVAAVVGVALPGRRLALRLLPPSDAPRASAHAESPEDAAEAGSPPLSPAGGPQAS